MFDQIFKNHSFLNKRFILKQSDHIVWCMIHDIIKELDFKIDDITIRLTKEQFENNISKVIKKNILFSDPNKRKKLFKYDRKTKISNISTIKQFMGFMNSLLSEWGLILNIKRKITTKRENNKKISIAINFYILNFIDNGNIKGT